MRIARYSIAVLVGVTLVLAGGCSSGGSDDATDGDDEQASSNETASPAKTVTGSAPTATSEKSKAPRFSSGPWTTGEAEARVSGAASITVRGTLNKNASSDKDTTRLTFVAGTDTISISISNVFEAFAMAVYKEPVDVQSNSASPCEISYSETTDKKVAGSFRCTKARVSSAGAAIADTTIEGTFVASR